MGLYRLTETSMTPKLAKPTIRLGASAVTGRSHISSGKGCEDAVAFRRFRRNAAMPSAAYIALADGAGSAPEGFAGANLLVGLIGRMIHDNRKIVLDGGEEARRFLHSGLHEALVSEASRLRHPLRDLASTLLFVYLDRDDGRYIAGHIGDGVIVIRENDSCAVLSPPDKGEFANETVFFTSSSASVRLRLYTGIATSNIGFMLMSDGTADSLYGKRSGELAAACGQVFLWFENYPEKMASEALANSLNSLIAKNTHDDCSIAIMQTIGGKFDRLASEHQEAV